MSYWSPERIALLHEVWAKSTHAQLVEHFPGQTYNAIRKKAHRLGLPHRNVVIGELGLPVTTLPAQAVEPEFDVDAAVRELKKRGIEIEKRPTITDKVFDLTSVGRFDGDLVRIGIVSDTHLCSKYQQLTHLHSCYQRFADEGVTTVLHAGDLVEGIRMYRGWEQSVLEHGADGQVTYAVKHYPKQPGITTYVVSGNHDDSFRSNAGVNVVRRVCDLREDFRYLGDHGAYIDLPGGMRAYLHHGMGGSAYSRSYKIQKAVENFAPEAKPHLYIVGHYHITVTLPDYRNVFAMHPGCFQAQSDFLRRLGVSPDVGGWILEYRVNPDSETFDLSEISARWIPFRKSIPNDY